MVLSQQPNSTFFQDPLSPPIDFLPAHGEDAYQDTPDATNTGFDDHSYLNDLGIYGATPSSEGTNAARNAALATPQVLPISNGPDPLILFSIPDYSQNADSSNTNNLNFDLPDIDWEVAVDDISSFNMPMGEVDTNLVELGLEYDMPPSVPFPRLASLDIGTSPVYEQPNAAIQTALTSQTASSLDTAPRLDGRPRDSFANHRDYQLDLSLQRPTHPILPVGQLTPSPNAKSLHVQDSSHRDAFRSRVSGFSPALPEKSAEHPWVRKTGARSAGGATRTGKINQYRAEDFYAPSRPINQNFWQARNGTKFEYNKWGELDGTTMTLSSRDMKAFLFENPANLTLWIQTCPADSARRYHTIGSSRCRFVDCPARIYRNTIGVGILRVAIDEAFHSGGPQRDPHHVAGYMHLYCAERFLNWQAVCAHLDVRADERTFATEPNSRWAASLAKFPGMADVAKRFIKYARHDAQNGTKLMATKFPDYPQHFHPYGAPKEHARTLTYAMMKVKMDKMNAHRRKQMQSRGEKDSHQTRNLGDLEQAVNDRRATALEKKRKWLADQAGDEDDNDNAELAASSATPASGGNFSQRNDAPFIRNFTSTRSSSAINTAFFDTAHATAGPAKRMYFTAPPANDVVSRLSGEEYVQAAPTANRDSAQVYPAVQQTLSDETEHEYTRRLASTTIDSGGSSGPQVSNMPPRKTLSALVSYTSDSDDDGDASES